MTEHNMDLIPVGVVHSEIRVRGEMPAQGVTGIVEIFPGYEDALDGIGKNSHLILLCWMHEGERALLKAVPRKQSSRSPEKGVFALRSPSRPNPVSVSVVGLLGIRDDRFIELSHLDVIDGTPVLDIKPYQPGWDCVFSATNGDRTGKINEITTLIQQQSLLREAINYHGEMCAGVAVAVRIALAGARILGVDLHRTTITCPAGCDSCIADGLIGITGARPGNGQLHLREHTTLKECFSLSSPNKRLDFYLRPMPGDIEEILACDDRVLFEIETLIP